MYLLFHRSHSASTAGYTNRFHPTRFAGPGIDRNRSPNALLTGIQHNGFGPQRPYSLFTEGFEGH